MLKSICRSEWEWSIFFQEQDWSRLFEGVGGNGQIFVGVDRIGQSFCGPGKDWSNFLQDQT